LGRQRHFLTLGRSLGMKCVRIVRLLCIGLVLVGAFVASPEALAQQTVTQNVDRPGLDYDNFDMRADNPDLCKQACFADIRCKAWAFVKPHTSQGPKPRHWLKTGVPSPVRNTCCASGVITVQAPPPPPPGGGEGCDPPICCIKPDLPLQGILPPRAPLSHLAREAFWPLHSG
jgi:hypothetical protein